jgi:hypothetical protein
MRSIGSRNAFDIHVADRYANDGILTGLNRKPKAESTAADRQTLAGRKKSATAGRELQCSMGQKRS